jgi:hypothetical protein
MDFLSLSMGESRFPSKNPEWAVGALHNCVHVRSVGAKDDVANGGKLPILVANIDSRSRRVCDCVCVCLRYVTPPYRACHGLYLVVY